MSAQGAFAQIAAEDGRAALVTVVSGERRGAKLLIRADGTTEGGLGDAELERIAVEAADDLLWEERSELIEAGETSLFIDVTGPGAAARDLRRGGLRRRALPARACGGLAPVRVRPALPVRDSASASRTRRT